MQWNYMYVTLTYGKVFVLFSYIWKIAPNEDTPKHVNWYIKTSSTQMFYSFLFCCGFFFLYYLFFWGGRGGVRTAEMCVHVYVDASMKG